MILLLFTGLWYLHLANRKLPCSWLSYLHRQADRLEALFDRHSTLSYGALCIQIEACFQYWLCWCITSDFLHPGASPSPFLQPSLTSCTWSLSFLHTLLPCSLSYQAALSGPTQNWALPEYWNSFLQSALLLLYDLMPWVLIYSTTLCFKVPNWHSLLWSATLMQLSPQTAWCHKFWFRFAKFYPYSFYSPILLT